jgi:glutathione peroxidase-family protein
MEKLDSRGISWKEISVSEFLEQIDKGRDRKKKTTETLPKAWNKVINDFDFKLLELLAEPTESMCGFRPEIEDIKDMFNRFKESLLLQEIPIKEFIVSKNDIKGIKNEPFNAKATQMVSTSGRGEKSEYILSLLQQAGEQGITWPAIQDALRANFGGAPKKRRIFYSLLNGCKWHKTTWPKGIVTYYFDQESNSVQN